LSVLKEKLYTQCIFQAVLLRSIAVDSRPYCYNTVIEKNNYFTATKFPDRSISKFPKFLLAYPKFYKSLMFHVSKKIEIKINSNYDFIRSLI